MKQKKELIKKIEWDEAQWWEDGKIYMNDMEKFFVEGGKWGLIHPTHLPSQKKRKSWHQDKNFFFIYLLFLLEFCHSKNNISKVILLHNCSNCLSLEICDVNISWIYFDSSKFHINFTVIHNTDPVNLYEYKTS